MDYKKSKAPTNTVTRNIMDLCEDTGNIYESVAIISKRANQISSEIKQDLSKKLQEFASYNDSLEEVFENREQIEISRYYEKLPKPTLLATHHPNERSTKKRNINIHTPANIFHAVRMVLLFVLLCFFVMAFNLGYGRRFHVPLVGASAP